MAQIRSRDTKPELLLRRALHGLGLRYRLGGAGLPGRPDLVFPRHRAVLFVHGCFWHRHPGCKVAATPKTNGEFWSAKFERNVERDAVVQAKLTAQDWRVFVAWECEIVAKSRLPNTADRLQKAITTLSDSSAYLELQHRGSRT